MLAAERRQYILDYLQREGRLLASQLSSELAVSEDTIRRDLRDLAEEGLIQRVHGGALPRSPAATSYGQRTLQAPEAKKAIAQAAANLCRNGQVIFLDGGTTNLLVAQQLPPALRATVVTHSPNVAVALISHPTVEVVLLGGRLYKDSLVAVGAATVEAVRNIRADLFMMGVCSLHPEVGISTSDLEESYVKKAMIASSAEVVALASAEKLGTATPYIVGALRELDYIVTDHTLPAEALAPYASLGISVIRA